MTFVSPNKPLHITPKHIFHCIQATSPFTKYNHTFTATLFEIRNFPVAHMVKNLLAMLETWVWSLGGEYPLEKGMATHSSMLGWRIPWTEEPGWLQSMGSQRVGHNWATKHTHTHTHIFILFQILYPYKLLQNIEFSSLCCTVDPCWLSIRV